MGYSYRHEGASLPIKLDLDETEVQAPCPTCVRAELDGSVKVMAPAERKSGVTPAQCSRGHLVMVSWTRAEA
jgi:hypothetical protein